MTAMLALLLQNQGEGPIYKNRHLSEWVELSGRAVSSFEAQDDYDSAMKAAGTNAFPFLIKWLHHEGSQFRFTLLRPLESRLSFQQFYNLGTSAGAARANGASKAISDLGTNAPPEFIHELARLMNDQSAPETAVRATITLARLGQPGLRELTRALEHQSSEVQYFAVHMLKLLHQQKDLNLPEKFFLPQLIVLASETNSIAPVRVQSLFKQFLSELNIEPDQYAPALTNLLSDPDSQVRNAASNALLKIAPEMLTNAPPQNGASQE